MKTRLQNSIGKFRAPSKSVAICAAIASTLALLAIPAQAQKITYTVENHSFEDPVLFEAGYRNSRGYALTIASWTRGDYRRGTAVAYFPNQSNFKAPPNGIDGNNVFSTSGTAVGVQAWVTQDVSGATLLAEAGRKYTLTVAAGKIPRYRPRRTISKARDRNDVHVLREIVGYCHLTHPTSFPVDP